MNSKTQNKIAIGALYGIAGFVVLILLALLGYILVSGMPQLSWHFLTAPAKAFLKGFGPRQSLS